MSKKHKKAWNQQVSYQAPGISQEAEYRIIKFDLVKVIILNLVYLAAILGLYYANQHSHILDKWFGRILHF